jgi:hypothetical protein
VARKLLKERVRNSKTLHLGRPQRVKSDPLRRSAPAQPQTEEQFMMASRTSFRRLFRFTDTMPESALASRGG